VTPAPPAKRKLFARIALLWTRLRGGSLSPGRAAASVAVGLFVGSIPVFGVQFFIVLLVCVPLRLDAALAYIVAHVSNPVTFPLFVAAELEVGSLCLTGRHATLTLEAAKQLGFMGAAARLGIGALVVGSGLALVGAAVTWLVAHGVQDARDRAVAASRARALSRYGGAPRSVRSYVGLKLRTDPALRALLDLPGSFGRVVDVGCGFGQVGLCLLELGRCASLLGIDDDEARIRAFAAAARGDATVVKEHVTTATFPAADTILFIDVLHYLAREAQDGALDRAASALSAGGRLLIREVHAGASWRSTMTEWMERRAARRRGLSEPLVFRSASEWIAALEQRGLECTLIEHQDLSIAHNVLVVGTRPDPTRTERMEASENSTDAVPG
jgi:uncharacterized protein (DUF2062 family)/precorrin-6B methylase 2